MAVFVYGTLADPERAVSVLDEFHFAGAAVLDGLHRVDGTYPTLAPGGRVAGRLLHTAEIDRLDAYEGVDTGYYVRETVPRTDGGTVEVYVGDPGRLGAAADWPGDGSFRERVRAYLAAADVAVRPA